MGTPEDKSATNKPDIGSLVKQIKVDEEGNFVFPEDAELTEELKFAAIAEKRRRDTQASYTKAMQELKAAQAKLRKLEEITAPPLDIDEQTREELEALKFEDPEKWRARMNQLEREAQAKHRQALDEAAKEAQLAAELERRAMILADFNRSRGLNITDEVIQFDVPPRITKKLEKGEISFEAFLEEVAQYLESPKKVQVEHKDNQPDLSKVGGSDSPQDKAEPTFEYNSVVF